MEGGGEGVVSSASAEEGAVVAAVVPNGVVAGGVGVLISIVR